MTDFDPRIDHSLLEPVEDLPATGRDSAKRSVAEQRRMSQDDAEVTPKRVKRRFSAAEKLRILAAADECRKHGELGALLRREGLFSSQVAQWRALRDQGELGALTPKKRGRKPNTNPLAAKLAEAEKQIQKLTKKLERADEIIQVQKKFAEMFGKIITLPEDIEKM